ncbi:MAG: response regulator [Bacteroidetes bacterium 24-39-8]|jgi:DNA-binding response OmpR family regulator|nr:MAG: response regulator [Bacteroidetes bacterium 24-39-8]HQS55046.1 response regulator transcription factor [Sediminibacterium sp.]
MKILVAEDDTMLLKTIELKLKKEGYEVYTTADGRETQKEILRIRPDMIITDVMMPYASGLEIVSMVRQKLNWKIPIIILSSMEQEAVVMNAFGLGADDYITKPFSLNELAIRVKRLLSRPR